MAVVALTDIHGRFDLLELMCEKLKKANLGPDTTLVLCGDYMDRGPQSKEVMDAVMAGTSYFTFAKNVVVLKGNHEDIFYYALYHNNWEMLLNNGGYATMRSLLGLTSDSQVDKAILSGHNNTVTALARDPYIKKVLNFIEFAMDLIHVEGKYIFVHAGMNPHVPAATQIRDKIKFAEIFTWIRDMWLRENVDLGYTVVHGHTPHSHDPYRGGADYRINLDSGACWTGTLTGLIIHDTNDRKANEIITVQNKVWKSMYLDE